MTEEDNMLGIKRHGYTSQSGQSVPTYWYRQPTGVSWQTFLDETISALAAFYGSTPPAEGGTLCVTLEPWVSGGVTQPAITVCRDVGESLDDFLARAKRVFHAALTANPPD